MPIHSLSPAAATGAAAGTAAAPAATTASTPAPLPPGTSSVPGGAVAARNVGRGSVMRSLSPAHQQIARDTYQANRLYHGTSAAGKASIQQHGFDIDRKAGGATETIPDAEGTPFAMTAAAHNYLTGNRDTAKAYAVTSREKPPALVRAMMDPVEAGLETDSDSESVDLAVRTSKSIPAGNVLQSKNRGDHSLSTGANQRYHEQLGNAGLHVSAEKAKDILADAQSDSDSDDFTGVHSMTAA